MDGETFKEYLLKKEQDVKNSTDALETIGVRVTTTFQCILCGESFDKVTSIYEHKEQGCKIKLELKKSSWEIVFRVIRNQSSFKSEGSFWASIQSLEEQLEEK